MVLLLIYIYIYIKVTCSGSLAVLTMAGLSKERSLILDDRIVCALMILKHWKCV